MPHNSVRNRLYEAEPVLTACRLDYVILGTCEECFIFIRLSAIAGIEDYRGIGIKRSNGLTKLQPRDIRQPVVHQVSVELPFSGHPKCVFPNYRPVRPQNSVA